MAVASRSSSDASLRELGDTLTDRARQGRRDRREKLGEPIQVRGDPTLVNEYEAAAAALGMSKADFGRAAIKIMSGLVNQANLDGLREVLAVVGTGRADGRVPFLLHLTPAQAGALAWHAKFYQRAPEDLAVVLLCTAIDSAAGLARDLSANLEITT